MVSGIPTDLHGFSIIDFPLVHFICQYVFYVLLIVMHIIKVESIVVE